MKSLFQKNSAISMQGKTHWHFCSVEQKCKNKKQECDYGFAWCCCNDLWLDLRLKG